MKMKRLILNCPRPYCGGVLELQFDFEPYYCCLSCARSYLTSKEERFVDALRKFSVKRQGRGYEAIRGGMR